MPENKLVQGQGAPLYNHETNAYEWVAAKDIAAAMATGKYTAPAGSVESRAGGGVVSRPVDQLGAAEAQGEQSAADVTATRRERERHEARKADLSDPVHTFAEGMTDAMTLGLIHGTSERDALRREEDSGSALLGQLAGTVTGLGTPGLVSGTAKGGRALGRSVAKSFVKDVESAGSRALVRGLEEAGENAALMGATAFGHNITDAVIADKPFSAEVVGAETGLGALMGFGTGWLGSTFGRIAKGSRQAVVASGIAAKEADAALGAVRETTSALDEVVEQHARQLGVLDVLAKDGHFPQQLIAPRSAALREAEAAARALKGLDGSPTGQTADYVKWRDAVERYNQSVRKLDDVMSPNDFERLQLNPRQLGSAADVPAARKPVDTIAQWSDDGGISPVALERDAAMTPERRAAFKEIYGREFETVEEALLREAAETTTDSVKAAQLMDEYRAAQLAGGAGVELRRGGLDVGVRRGPGGKVADKAGFGTLVGGDDVRRIAADAVPPAGSSQLLPEPRLPNNAGIMDVPPGTPTMVGRGPALRGAAPAMMAQDVSVLAARNAAPTDAMQARMVGNMVNVRLGMAPTRVWSPAEAIPGLPAASQAEVGEAFARTARMSDTLPATPEMTRRLPRPGEPTVRIPRDGEPHPVTDRPESMASRPEPTPVNRDGATNPGKRAKPKDEPLTDKPGDTAEMPKQDLPSMEDKLRKEYLDGLDLSGKDNAKVAVKKVIDDWANQAKDVSRVRAADVLDVKMKEALDKIAKVGGSRLDSAGALELGAAMGLKPAMSPLGQRLDQIWAISQAGKFASDAARGVKTTPLAGSARKGILGALERYALRRGARGIAGAAAGATFAGPLGAMLGYALTSAGFAGSVASASGRVMQQIAKAGSALLSGTSGRVIRRAAVGNRPYQYDESGPIEDPVERIQVVQRLSANPDLVRSQVRTQLGDLVVTSPELAQHMEEAAVRQIQSLSISAPAIYFTPTGQPINPSRDALKRFTDFENAIHDLPGLLAAVQSGAASESQIRALHLGFPAVHGQLAREVLGQTDLLKKLNSAKLTAVGRVLGVPLTRAASDPQYVMRMQAGWTNPGGQPQGKAQALKITAPEPTPTQAASTGRAPGNQENQ